jgi:glycosyltransferase involved in cell wall biosynthesis
LKSIASTILSTVHLERALSDNGHRGIRFTIVGDGSERRWLRQQMRRTEFTGVLRGEALAAAYANMDVFAFPSDTQADGNVVLEAMASGVPVVAMARGGPRCIDESGTAVALARDEAEFIDTVRALATDPLRRRAMRASARALARERSWDRIFDGVYRAYSAALIPTSSSSLGHEEAAAAVVQSQESL